MPYCLYFLPTYLAAVAVWGWDIWESQTSWPHFFSVPIITVSAQSPSQCGLYVLNPQAWSRQWKCHSSHDKVSKEAAGDIATPLFCGLRGCHCKITYLSLLPPNLASSENKQQQKPLWGTCPFLLSREVREEAAPPDAVGMVRSPSPGSSEHTAASRCHLPPSLNKVMLRLLSERPAIQPTAQVAEKDKPDPPRTLWLHRVYSSPQKTPAAEHWGDRGSVDPRNCRNSAN